MPNASKTFLSEGHSEEFEMPMVVVNLGAEILSTSGNLLQDCINFAESIDAITIDGLVCADIPLPGYGEGLYHETGLDDALTALFS